jgi:hypothetical protein
MLHTCNMKLLRRVGLSLSVLLIPALVLNPAPAHAIVYPAGSVDTAWANGGYSNFGTQFWPADNGVMVDTEGGLLFPVSVDEGVESSVGIQMMSPNGQDDGLFAQVFEGNGYTYRKALDLHYDYSSSSWLLFSDTSKGLSISKFTNNGTLVNSFGTAGTIFANDLIKAEIAKTNITIPASIRISFLDMGVSANGAIFLLGQVAVRDSQFNLIPNHALNKHLSLWRFNPNGTIDTSIASTIDEGIGFSTTEGLVPGYEDSQAISSTGKLVFNDLGNKLTVIAPAMRLTGSTNIEFFVKRFDISSSLSNLKLNGTAGNEYFLSQLNWSGSEFWLHDGAESDDSKLLLVGEESLGTWPDSETYGIIFRLNYNSGAFANVANPDGQYFQRVVIDDLGRAVVSGFSSGFNQNYDVPTLDRYNLNGSLDSTFQFSQSRFAGAPGDLTSVTGLTISGDKLLVSGQLGGGWFCGADATISGCSISQSNSLSSQAQSQVNPNSTSGNFFTTAYRTSSLTVPDPPPPPAPAAPAPAVAPAPAPIVAPALPTQSAPVAVAAVVKAKKKISFPLKSSAGNTLIVGVSGSCSLSPVFKTVKVKVGKKTKKVKQQTGWTVQMKKKKQTCTITQTDAGGNGYAALSSTSTVTVK